MTAGDQPMRHGVLLFPCPQCATVLEVGVHTTPLPNPTRTSPSGWHYGHPVEFTAEAPHLHAELWGHMVREHGPNPHPYMPTTPRGSADE